MSMTLEEAVGQLLVVGFEGNGDDAPASILEAIARGEIGGVILFRRNVRDVGQVMRLNSSIHRAGASAPAVPFVAVDQEGGRVVRLREPLTPIMPMREVGATMDYDLMAQVAEVIATEVGALGFNVNFAPVLDVDTNPDNPVIGDRAFGRDPELVGRAGGAFLLGHLMSGVIPCGKHFPGHGDTVVDSHLGLPIVMHDPERIEAVELAPFRRAIAAGMPMLMTAHMLLPAYDALLPATLSSALLTGLLREQMGFEGVIISDDLEMRAVADHYGLDDMIALGLSAGVDIYLICHTESKWRQARERLLELGRTDAVARTRILESAGRVVALKEAYLASWPRPWSPAPDVMDLLGCARHSDIVARVGAMQELGRDPTEA